MLRLTHDQQGCCVQNVKKIGAGLIQRKSALILFY